jgi:hypothetical protein
MPRYFFHIFNDETTMDEEGQELPNLKAARERAIKDARHLMTDSLRDGRIELSHHIAVQDDKGRLLADVKFGDAVAIRL